MVRATDRKVGNLDRRSRRLIEWSDVHRGRLDADLPGASLILFLHLDHLLTLTALHQATAPVVVVERCGVLLLHDNPVLLCRRLHGLAAGFSNLAVIGLVLPV